MSATYIGTTHSSKHNGHGRKEPRMRFAIKSTGLVRGEPTKGKTAPWFLRQWGSRPASKRPAPLEMVA